MKSLWVAVVSGLVGIGIGAMPQAPKAPKVSAPVLPENVRIWQAVTPGLSLADAEKAIGVKGAADLPGKEGDTQILNRSYRIGAGAITVRYEQVPGDEEFRVDNKLLLEKFE